LSTTFQFAAENSWIWGVLVPGATEFGERDTNATADFSGV
jgi:hypothetical protein